MPRKLADKGRFVAGPGGRVLAISHSSAPVQTDHAHLGPALAQQTRSGSEPHRLPGWRETRGHGTWLL